MTNSPEPVETEKPEVTNSPEPVETKKPEVTNSPEPVETKKPEVTNSPEPIETEKPEESNSPTPSITPEPGKETPEPSKIPDQTGYTVTFIDYDGSVLKEEIVSEGENVVPPVVSKRIGYIFREWSKDYSNIVEDTIIQAIYDKDTTPSLIVGDVITERGNTSVDVPVYINANPGVLGMTLSLLYDDKNVILKKAVNGDALKDKLTLTSANVFKNDCKFTWDGQELDDSDIKDGEIIVFTFELSDSIEPGDYSVNIYYGEGDIVDKDLQPVNLELRSGKITIKEE